VRVVFAFWLSADLAGELRPCCLGSNAGPLHAPVHPDIDNRHENLPVQPAVFT
jgi:hypothetical protein